VVKAAVFSIWRTLLNEKNYWGYELLLDCSGCDLEKISSADNIAAFTKALVAAIDMKAWGDPQIVNFGSEERVAGYTLVQLIETSSITGHFANASRAAYLNVHSCKPFDAEKAIAVVKTFFGPTRIKDQMIYRIA
jgi:S-adenosylmethionine/arginine decarboxylase-like enzyme